mgnify:FL=1
MNPAPLYVVGLGPGDAALLTPQAAAMLDAAQTIVGYRLYVDLISPERLRGKNVVTTGMRREADRCNAAIDAALAGSPTAVVCSGDAGIYGMSGLIFELLEARDLADAVPVTIAPGVPAVCAAAALLGAPLMHDFACVSLSDLLTPWERIEQRLEAALAADFVLALSNPRSKGRDWQLDRALELARRHRTPETPVGLVHKAYRPDQQTLIRPLRDFCGTDADMLSLLIIGNTTTRVTAERMVTPRGYAVTSGA